MLNSDEVIAHLSSLALGGATMYFGAHGLDPTTIQGGVSGAVALGVFIFKVYAHWNQKKVPESAVVMPQSNYVSGASVAQKQQ